MLYSNTERGKRGEGGGGGGRGERERGKKGGIYKWMRALIEKSFWSLSENSWTQLRTHFGRNSDQQSSPRSISQLTHLLLALGTAY